MSCYPALVPALLQCLKNLKANATRKDDGKRCAITIVPMPRVFDQGATVTLLPQFKVKICQTRLKRTAYAMSVLCNCNMEGGGGGGL